MARTYLTTSDLARAVGVHPNTVRLYEVWGFLPAVPRAPNGYRMFTPVHVDQMRLARLALSCTWAGGEIRRQALDMVLQAAAGDLKAALYHGRNFYQEVLAERNQAEAAAAVAEMWAQGLAPQETGTLLQIGQVAQLLNTTVDALRNWERNGLIQVPRDPNNGYRLYGPSEIARLRIIRALLRSKYSSMAVLRMLLRFDQGQRSNLRHVLDTPRPDEEVLYATDHWLSALEEIENTAQQALALLESMAAAAHS